MKTRYLKTLFLLLCVACMDSCSRPKWEADYSLMEYDFSSDAQYFSIDAEDFVHSISVNYWDGEWNDWNRNPEIASHGRVGPTKTDDLFLDGGWFTVSATHEPLRLEMNIDENEGNKPWQIQMYVKMVGRSADGEIRNTELGPGYQIHIHQAAGHQD